MQEKIRELNELMTEYSLLKDDPANKGRCKALKNQAANIVYSPDMLNMLKATVKKKLHKRFTRYEPDEFISETFTKYTDTYDSKVSDNFYAYFLKFLGYTVKNMTKSEHDESDPVFADEDGNEEAFTETAADNGPGTETLADINILFGEELSEEEAESRLKFMKYFSDLISCVVKAREHRGKKEEYYHYFATDFYIASCKAHLHSRYGMNEQEAFSIMDTGFADFTLSKHCEKFAEIEATPCKTYSDIGVAGKNFAVGELHTPFKNCVYTAYMGVTDGAVSQNRNKFYQDIGIMVSVDQYD